MTLTSHEIQQMNQTEKDNALYLAAAKGDMSELNALLVAGANPLLKLGFPRENTLISAARHGHLDVVNHLLEFPAVVAKITACDNAALRLAAEKGYLDVVNRLLEFPAVVAQITAESNYTFRSAAGKGHLNLMNRLLEFPAVVAQITAENNDALRWSAENGHLDVVNRLLEFPAVVAEITSLSNDILHGAIIDNHLNVVNRLLEFPAVEAQITAINNYALRLALECGSLDVMNRLLEYPVVIAEITCLKYPDLSSAAMEGYLDEVNRLLEFPAVKQALDDITRKELTELGFYEWQNTQRRQILSTIKGMLHQGMVPGLIMPILKRNHPSFSEAVLNKQIEFGKKQLREAMATPAAPLTFAAPAIDSNDKKRNRDTQAPEPNEPQATDVLSLRSRDVPRTKFRRT